jgi:hypothetical protein
MNHVKIAAQTYFFSILYLFSISCCTLKKNRMCIITDALLILSNRYNCSCFNGFKLQEDLRNCAATDALRCERKGCDGELCRPKDDVVNEVECFCPNGMELKADEKTCEVSLKKYTIPIIAIEVLKQSN